MNKKSLLLTFALTVLVPFVARAQFGILSPLHTHGTELQDEQGNHVVLHGVMDTPSPYFNNGRWGTSASTAYVNRCIEYFDKLYTAVTDTTKGAYCNVFRLHLDPCWCFVNGKDESDYAAFKESRFKQFWEKLYWPLIQKALGHGLYVVVRPPGVCPEEIQVNGGYQDYLKTVWNYISQDDSIRKYAGFIQLELANEPVNILDANGKQDNTGSAPHDFFQPIADLIRQNGFTGIIWVPGAGYQSIYNGYKEHPIAGYNIGYAVHNYPEWYGSDQCIGNPEKYIQNFVNMVPVVESAPVIITEIDWSPEKEGEGKYNEFGQWVPANYGTWGTATTSGWGTLYQALIDKYGISMNLTGVGDYIDIDTYINKGEIVPFCQGNAEACGEACMAWYKAYAQTDFAYPSFERVRYSDQGDGTYINPIINADFPDPDVIRVDDTFYMLSTTFHHLPGATLLKSHDLVNWEYCANPLSQLADDNKHNLLDGKGAYAEGMWASALGYSNGTYYILISSLDVGGSVLTATDPAGPWTYRKLNDNYYDCGMLFEGDYIYVSCGINRLHVVKLDRQFNRVADKEVIVRDDSGLEGSKIYHIGNYYYIYATYGGTEGSQTIFRSTEPMGTYEEVGERVMKGQHIHQGALVDTPTGEWWTVLFKDDGAIGRIPYLEPVAWNNGWPTIGNDGIDVSKNGVAYTKPNVGQAWPRAALSTNETFTALNLGLQWQWNHQPDASAWSLIENPGNLRLYTAGKANNLKEARNSLTQRIIALHNEGTLNSKKPQVYGTMKVDVSHMQDGDVCGLAVFQDPYSWVGVKQLNGVRHLYVYRSAYDSNAEFEKDCGELTTDVVYLQARANFGTSKVTYYYSTDNVTYSRAISNSFDMRFLITVFAGQRFYLFNYSTENTGGYVDIDWFSTETAFSEEQFYSPERLQTFSAEDLQLDHIDIDSRVEVLNGGTTSLPVYAVMRSGMKQPIAANCSYDLDDESIASISRGIVTGLKEGEAQVTATYTDYEGTEHQFGFSLAVESFPIREGLFNPSIVGEGTFNAQTGEFITSSKGQAGWEYSVGLNIATTSYLVIEMEEKPAVSTTLCLYDKSGSYTRTITSATTKLKLSNVTKIDKQAVTRVSFQTNGGKAIRLKRVFLSEDGETPSDIESVVSVEPGNNLWYNLQGMQTRIPEKQGVYIQNGRKIVIK
ncbi:MAG: family 43 glycosylhydrolase [Bacteroidales bacterium]|nr:family 43 glycosylhydrolase [Bacteroidales bacterium]MBR0037166.1 family 43 glycosylhydrolase [Bacteroidales bacterium]